MSNLTFGVRATFTEQQKRELQEVSAHDGIPVRTLIRAYVTRGLQTDLQRIRKESDRETGDH